MGHSSKLDKWWGFKSLGSGDVSYWDDDLLYPVQGGFDPTGFFVDFAADPYTAIVPRSGATSHFDDYWTELRAFKVYGEEEFLGTTRRWDDSVTFNYPFDLYTASAIEFLSSTGTATLSGASKRGEYTIDLWGRIEDGKWLRGKM